MTDVVEVDTTPAALGADVGAARLPRSRALARDQVVVVGGQLAAGVGNLAFSLLMARILGLRGFTAQATFMVGYLLLHLPAAAFGAGSALEPALARALRRRALVVAGAVAVALVVFAPTLATSLRQPTVMPVLLAAATPTAALLALERGRLYGTASYRVLVTSLSVEPLVRLSLGVLLAVAFGATGAAVGVVLAGYAALGVAWGGRRVDASPVASSAARPTAAVVSAFLLLALLQNQDILVATKVLDAGEAARFAALSTLGGMAAFATATVPLVLLPRLAVRDSFRGAFHVALGVAVAIGVAATLGIVVAGSAVVALAFGPSYSSIVPLAAPYVGAMALLGVVRVLVADVSVRARAMPVLVILVGAVVLHLALLATATSTGGAVLATVVTMSATTVATGTLVVSRTAWFAERRWDTRLRAWWLRAWPVTTITVGALVLRLLVTRGIWVDEAISVSAAKLPFGRMLEQLQHTDVQPPLHSAILWVTVRVAGSGELAIRSTSIVAGALVVPVLYLLGRELYGRRTGVVAALVGAVSPLAIWYSQEARMYALYMLFAVVALYAQVRALRDGRAWWWVLYGVATAALLWTQYLSFLFVLAQQVVFVVELQRRRRAGEPLRARIVGWAGALVLAVVLLLPLLPYLGQQLTAYADRGAGLSSVPAQAGTATSAQPGLSVYTVIANLLWAIGGYHADRTMELLAALWPLGTLAGLALLGRNLDAWSRRLVLLVAMPMVILFLVGLQRPDLFELRYVASVVPILALLAARVVTALVSRVRFVVLGAALLALLSLVALADQQLNGANPRLYDFRGAVHEIAAEAKPGDRLLYNPVYLESVVHYYAPKVHSEPIGAWRGAIKARGRIFVIGSFFDKRAISGATGTVLAQLERERNLVDVVRRPQIRVWVFQ